MGDHALADRFGKIWKKLEGAVDYVIVKALVEPRSESDLSIQSDPGWSQVSSPS